MSKGGNKLIISFIIAIVIVCGLIFILENKNFKDVDKEQAETVDLVALAEEYKDKIIEIMPAYEELATSESADVTTINSLREKLLNLKMPADFKNLHIELVLLLDKMEEGFNSAEFEKRLNEIKAQYNWLNK